MAPERYVLAFDDETGELGDVALRLLRMGFDVLYARSADEAWLLARQEAERIQALLFPPGTDPAHLARITAALTAPEGRRPCVLVAVGKPPQESVRKQLREAGVGWAVWEPGEDGALRFVVNAATRLPEEVVPRHEPRVPTTRLASFYEGEQRKDAVLYTLSPRGAFLETASPAPVGATVALEIWFSERQFQTLATVQYTCKLSEVGRAKSPAGMGVVFGDLKPPSREFLRAYIARRAECFTV